MKPLAVVLLSGGMDSCVTAAVASGEYRLALLHATYGQRTQRREAEAFRQQAGHFGAEKTIIISMEYFSALGGSSLTDPLLPVPRGDLNRSSIPSTYVPFRNAAFLSAAVSWSEVIGAEAVFIGAVEEDSSGYPDCRKSFLDAFGDVVRTGTKAGSGLRIVAPVINLSKKEIVRLGRSLGVPFHLTWSCYQEEEEACGRCDSCLLRLRGFQEAGISDPLPYRLSPSVILS